MSSSETPNKLYHEKYNKTKERLTAEEVRKNEVTYTNYIETDIMLELQDSKVKGGLHHHDEHLFIVVHQSFELWFKQILFELDSIKEILINAMTAETGTKNYLTMEAAQVCAHRLQRADTIFRYALGTFDVLETMHPADFLEFRDYIGPASGFQSVQLREIEVMLGLHDAHRVLHSGMHFSYFLRNNKKAIEKLEKRYKEPSLKQLVNKWLDSVYDLVPEHFVPVFLEKKKENLLFQKSLWINQTERVEEETAKEMDITEQFLKGVVLSSGHQDFHQQKKEIETKTTTTSSASNHHGNHSAVPAQAPEVEESTEAVVRRRVAMLFIMCYRHQVELTQFANLIDNIVAIEEGFVLWRTRHARMVERMIGQRPGTGGSTGVGYLDKTLQYRIFTELWQARSHFVRATALPHMRLKDLNPVLGLLGK